MTYERYQGPEDMEEEFLFCQPLQTTTTGEDIFMKVDSLFKEEGLLWRPCYSVCCDGAPAMLGARQGFIVSVKQENPSVMVVHCLLHHENLTSLKLSHELQKVMQEVTQVIKIIKARALNSRLFTQMCSDFGFEHIYLFYHSEVRWLSRGKVLQRLLEFWTETELFLTEKSHPLAHKFPESKWLMQVAYLADMFAELNSLNISMQGRDQTLVGLSEKLLAFKGKVKLWMNKIKSGKTASFPSFNLLLEDERFSLIQVQGIIEGHISKLIRECDHYIPENTLNYSWVRNPFNIEAEDLPDEIANISKLQQELSEIQNDATLHYNFKRQKESLSSFWIKVHKEKPNLRGEALKTLIPFATTFLSEAGFSALTVIKGKIQKPFATRR
ncbi:protein FAM200C-like [Palaemon carinicauda]|uniref:protein FAM200C-like n=1 Tax=Palaemon carinicauda TaxID=392227 RepID=UPI0035B5C017